MAHTVLRARAGCAIVRISEEHMITIQNVLVATDFSPVAAAALRYGLALARNFGARLHVLHVVDDLTARLAYADASMAGFSPVEMQREMEQAAGKALQALLSEEDRRNVQATTVLRVNHNAAKEITDYAKDASIDLVVVGATGRGALDRMLMGSVAEKVIRRAPCPVLAVRHPEREFVTPDVGDATPPPQAR